MKYFFSAGLNSEVIQNLHGLKDLCNSSSAIYFFQRAGREIRLSVRSTESNIMGPPGPRLGRALKLLHRKSGQNAVLSMTNTTDVSRVYQTADRADDRTDRTKRLVSLVTIFQQHYPTTTTTTTVSFHCQPLTRGDTGSRVFL